MTSVADELRQRTARHVRALPIAERIALALALGDEDLALFLRATRLGKDEALRALRATREHGRALSRCAARSHP